MAMAACGATLAAWQAASAFLAEPAPAPSHGLASMPRAALARSAAGGVPMPGASAQASLSRTDATMLGLGLIALGARAASRNRVQRRASSYGAGDIEDAVPFELRGFSLSTLVLGLGAVLLTVTLGDYAFFGQSGGSGIGAVLLIYSVPVFLLGLALQYAQLDPVPVEVLPGADGLFESKATETLRKVKKDVTRHRYGDDAHLDTSLKALGLTGKGRYPQLKAIYEGKSPDGELEFTMHFESKDVPYTTWSNPMIIKACDRFFGPSIWSEVSKVSSEKKVAALKLTTGARPADKPIAQVAGVVDQSEKAES